jgi:hypothetical protein
MNVKLKITFVFFKWSFVVSDGAHVVMNFIIYISSNINSLCVGIFLRNVITDLFVDSGSFVETVYHENS